MGELVAAILRRTGTKIALGLIVLALGVWFIGAGLAKASAADACAQQLAAALQAKDRGFVEASVRNPSLASELLRAPHTELLFVRPLSAEWTRVGVLVKTASVAKNVALQLKVEPNGCMFLRDY